MKKEIQESMDWVVGIIKKYGVLVGIIVAGYYGIKKIWFWFAMPLMFLVSLRALANVFSWKWIIYFTPTTIIVMWVFLFSLLAMCFKKQKKEE